MTSRPVAPELLSAMVDGCFAFAREMLEKAGEFFPFGETADAEGKRSMVGGYDGNEHPDPRDIYRLLHGGFRDGAHSGQFAAAALAVNVDIPIEYEPAYSDGVRVLIEAPGYSRYIYLPYQILLRSALARLTKRHRAVEFAEPFAVAIPPQLFRPDA